MSINRYTEAAPVSVDFYKTPLEPFMKGLELKQQKYDQAFDVASSIDTLDLPALEDHQDLAANILNDYRSQLAQMNAKYDGDYSKMGRDLQKLAGTIKRDHQQGGRAYNIATRLNEFNQWDAEHKARVGKDLEPFQYDAAKQHLQSKINEDPSKPLDTFTLSPYYDIHATLPEAISQIEAWAQPYGGIKFDESTGNMYVTEQGQKVFISPEQIRDTLLPRYLSDQAFLSYAKDYAMTNNLSEEDVITELVDGVINRAVNAKHFVREQANIGGQFDPGYLASLRSGGENDPARVPPSQYYSQSYDFYVPDEEAGRASFEGAAVSFATSLVELGLLDLNPNQIGQDNVRDLINEMDLANIKKGIEENPQEIEARFTKTFSETYNALENMEGWEKMSSKEKSNKFFETYNSNMVAQAKSSLLIDAVGPDTAEYLEDQLIDQRRLPDMTFTVLDNTTGKVVGGTDAALSWNEFHKFVSSTKGGWSVGASTEIKPEDFKVKGMVGAMNNVMPSIALSHKMDRKRNFTILAHGYDAEWDRLSTPLLMFASTRNPKIDKSDWAAIPGYGDTHGQSRATNIYDDQGRFIDRQILIHIGIPYLNEDGKRAYKENGETITLKQAQDWVDKYAKVHTWRASPTRDTQINQ